MRGVIDSAAGLKTVGWATTLEQARAQLPTLAADVVLADLQLADGWVADFVDELANSGRYGWPKTLLATLSLDDSQLLNALARGADGYFVQGLSPNMLIATVEQGTGGAEMAPVIARQVKAHFDASAWTVKEPLDDDNPLHPGSASRRQVLQWICDGFLPARDRARPAHQHAQVAQRVRTLYHQAAPGPAHRVAVAAAALNPDAQGVGGFVSMKLCRVASFSASFARLAWRPRQSISGKRKSR